jgi:hypothetical protein
VTVSQQVQPFQSGSCTGSRPQGYQGLASGDGSEFAIESSDPGVGAGNPAVGAALISLPIYPYLAYYPSEWAPPFTSTSAYSGDPAIASLALVNALMEPSSGGLTQQIGAWVSIGRYHLSEWRGPAYQGFVMYYAYPDPTNDQPYALIIRYAVAINSRWKSDGAKALYIAATMQCVVQSFPSSSTPDLQSVPADSGSDYNAILGTEWVHDATTGQDYLVDSSNYSETGPDGAGYYKVNGNDIQKLQPGFQ